MQRLPICLALLALGPAGALRSGAAPRPSVDGSEEASVDVIGQDLRELFDIPAASAQEGRGAGASSPQTKYLFFTHHKTGTNLMQQLCNLTAKIVSNNTEQCHWCYEVMGVSPDGGLICPKDPIPVHGPFRGSAGRFTLISTVNAREFGLVQKFAPSYRAVHMLRDPTSMLASDYEYDMSLTMAKAGEAAKDRWDVDADKAALRASMEQGLQETARYMARHLDYLCTMTEATKSDPNVLTMSLEAFGSHYRAAAERLFGFMFGAHHPKMQDLLQAAARWDLSSSPRAKAQAYVGKHEHTQDVKAKIREMVRAKDPTVMAATSCEAAERARPWSQYYIHR